MQKPTIEELTRIRDVEVARRKAEQLKNWRSEIEGKIQEQRKKLEDFRLVFIGSYTMFANCPFYIESILKLGDTVVYHSTFEGDTSQVQLEVNLYIELTPIVRITDFTRYQDKGIDCINFTAYDVDDEVVFSIGAFPVDKFNLDKYNLLVNCLAKSYHYYENKDEIKAIVALIEERLKKERKVIRGQIDEFYQAIAARNQELCVPPETDVYPLTVYRWHWLINPAESPFEVYSLHDTKKDDYIIPITGDPVKFLGSNPVAIYRTIWRGIEDVPEEFRVLSPLTKVSLYLLHHDLDYKLVDEELPEKRYICSAVESDEPTKIYLTGDQELTELRSRFSHLPLTENSITRAEGEFYIYPELCELRRD